MEEEIYRSVELSDEELEALLKVLKAEGLTYTPLGVAKSKLMNAYTEIQDEKRNASPDRPDHNVPYVQDQDPESNR